MKTKRTAKGEKPLTLTEIKHLREMTNGTLKGAKFNFRFQKTQRESNPRDSEPCWDWKTIARKLNQPV